EDCARLWLRTRRVCVVQDFRSAIVVTSNRFHGSRLRWKRNACVVGDSFKGSAHWLIFLAPGHGYCERAKARQLKPQLPLSATGFVLQSCVPVGSWLI